MDVDPGKGLHYLDNASTTFPKPERVMEAMLRFGASAGVSPGRSTFDLAIVADSALNGCRKKLNAFFNPSLSGGIRPQCHGRAELVIFGRPDGHTGLDTARAQPGARPIAHCVDDWARATPVPFDASYGSRRHPQGDRKDTRLVVVNHAQRFPHGANCSDSLYPPRRGCL
jgi:hypothetical protein